MLEIRAPALCADRVRAPSRSRIHLRLCSVQCSVASVRDRVTVPESASLRTSGFEHFRAPIATDLESYPCTSRSATSVESYSYEKGRGVPPPRLATPPFRAANLPKMEFAVVRLTAGLSSGFSGLQAHEAGSSSPLECALTQKQGWGVPPPAGFLQ